MQPRGCTGTSLPASGRNQCLGTKLALELLRAPAALTTRSGSTRDRRMTGDRRGVAPLAMAIHRRIRKAARLPLQAYRRGREVLLGPS